MEHTDSMGVQICNDRFPTGGLGKKTESKLVAYHTSANVLDIFRLGTQTAMTGDSKADSGHSLGVGVGWGMIEEVGVGSLSQWLFQPGDG
ncbi:hypothetical protein Tco_0084970 [Tanacetum coccineum]